MSILTAKGTIRAAWSANGNVGAVVGSNGVTAIRATEENGAMAPVPWLVVFKGNHIHKRLNVAMMECIEYEEPK